MVEAWDVGRQESSGQERELAPSRID